MMEINFLYLKLLKFSKKKLRFVYKNLRFSKGSITEIIWSSFEVNVVLCLYHKLYIFVFRNSFCLISVSISGNQLVTVFLINVCIGIYCISYNSLVLYLYRTKLQSVHYMYLLYEISSLFVL